MQISNIHIECFACLLYSLGLLQEFGLDVHIRPDGTDRGVTERYRDAPSLTG